jgi:hypothetical protein
MEFTISNGKQQPTAKTTVDVVRVGNALYYIDL